MRVLRDNPYPGRGIVMGMDETGKNMVQIYWIMGRSENSRNRIFRQEGGRLFTEALYPAKVENSCLIIYNAMQETKTFFVVSNGCQTDEVLNHPGARGLPYGLDGYQYEPDSPNYTPRITGAWYRDIPSFQFAVLRKSRWSEACDRIFYTYETIAPGFGYCITTYLGVGNPLPAFTGEPLLMLLPGDINEVLGIYWNALNEENRVSLAVKFIQVSTGKSVIRVENKFHKV